MSIRGNIPFRDYEMSSKGHLHTLVQTQFKKCNWSLWEERVDFSQLPQDFKNCRGLKLVKWNIFWPEFFSLVFTYTYRKYIVQFIIHILDIFSISVLHSLRDVLLFISGTIEARPFLVFEMGNAEGGSVKYRRLCSSIMCI